MKLLKKILLPVLAATSIAASPVTDVVLAQNIINDSSKTVQMMQPLDTLKSTISGHIYDEKTGEPLIGASVEIKGTGKGAVTDVDGFYKVQGVEGGEKNIIVRLIGHVPNEKKLLVDEQQENFDASLIDEVVQLAPINVTASRVNGTEASVLNLRKTSSSSIDGLSSLMIKKADDANAADALRRIPGLSIMDGRNPVMRGMGDKYSEVRLNGSELPGTDPDKKEVPTDLFPSGIIEEIIVSKTYTPDKPGTFSGGSADIITKAFPSKWDFSFSTGISSNTLSTGKNYFSTGNGQRSFLGLPTGVDDGSREKPRSLNSSDWLSSDSTRKEAGVAITSMGWTPKTSVAPLNSNYGLYFGGPINIGEYKKLGLVGSWTYGNSYKVRNENYSVFGGDDSNPKLLDYRIGVGTQLTSWGGSFGISFAPSLNHKFSLKDMITNNTSDEARQARGRDNELGDVEETRLRFLKNSLNSLQFSGEDSLPGILNSKIQWQMQYAEVDRDEPANRSNFYLLNADYSPGDTVLIWRPSGYSAASIYTKTHKQDNQMDVNWSLPSLPLPFLNPVSTKLGFFLNGENSSFNSKRYRFFNTSGRPPDIGDAEDIFTPDNLGPGHNQYQLVDGTFSDDHYTASSDNSAMYAMAEFPLSHRLKFIGGARIEDNKMQLDTGDRSTIDGKLHIESKTHDVLPLASLIWSVKDDINIRGSISHTIAARPQYRELSPFQFQDFVLGPLTRGNPNLKTTYSTNYDFRIEKFIKPEGVASFSLFYKSLENAIERAGIASGSRPYYTFYNADRAYDYGLEIEARSSLDFISKTLEGFSVGSNLTLVKSEVNVDDGQGVGATKFNRPLYGQSPWILNSNISYASHNRNTDFSLFYNAFGDRLSAAGRYGVGDQYEKTRHQVDATFKQRMFGRMDLKFSAKNLLNADDKETQMQNYGILKGKEETTREYKLGRTYGLGVTYSF